MSDPVLAARARLGVAYRRNQGDAAIRAARQDLTAAYLIRAIQKLAEADPPLSAQHWDHIAALLGTVRAHAEDGES